MKRLHNRKPWILTLGLLLIFALSSFGRDDSFDRSVLDKSWKFIEKDEIPGGNAYVIGGKLEIIGNGDELWSNFAQFTGVKRTDVTGDFDVSVQVQSMDDAHEWSKAGIMIANDIDSLSKGGYLLVAATPRHHGIICDFDYDGDGATDSHFSLNKKVSFKDLWLRVVKSGKQFTAFYKESKNAEWTKLNWSFELESANVNSQVGLFTFSHTHYNACKAVFDNYRDGRTWAFMDEDKVDGGTFDMHDSVVEITGKGNELWGSDADFNAVSRTDIKGDFDVWVRVDSLTDTHKWAKSGIIIANNLSNLSEGGYLLAAFTPENHGVIIDWDKNGDGVTDWHRNVGYTIPSFDGVWIRVKKVNRSFSIYWKQGEYGVWNQLYQTFEIESTNPNSEIGLFAFSHDNDLTCKAQFTNFTEASTFTPVVNLLSNQITINESDPMPTNYYSYYTMIPIEVSIDRPFNRDIIVPINLAGGTARSGIDHDIKGDFSVTIRAGATHGFNYRYAYNDLIIRGDRTLELELGDLQDITKGISDKLHIALIDNDLPSQAGSVFIMNSDMTVTESNSRLTFYCGFPGKSYGPVTMTWKATGTAVAGKDYSPQGGTVTFDDSRYGRNKTFTVEILDNNEKDEDKNLTISITSVTGGVSISGAPITVKIIDND